MDIIAFVVNKAFQTHYRKIGLTVAILGIYYNTLSAVSVHNEWRTNLAFFSTS